MTIMTLCADFQQEQEQPVDEQPGYYELPQSPCPAEWEKLGLAKPPRRVTVVKAWIFNSSESSGLEIKKKDLIFERNKLLSSLFYWFDPRIRKKLYKIDQELDAIELAARTVNGGSQKDAELQELLQRSKVVLSEGRALLSKRNGENNTSTSAQVV